MWYDDRRSFLMERVHSIATGIAKGLGAYRERMERETDVRVRFDISGLLPSMADATLDIRHPDGSEVRAGHVTRTDISMVLCGPFVPGVYRVALRWRHRGRFRECIVADARVHKGGKARIGEALEADAEERSLVRHPIRSSRWMLWP